MADKKFGTKRFCENCEVKFYDLNKTSPLTCPQCKTEIITEDNSLNTQPLQPMQQKTKQNTKDEFSEIENEDATSDAEEDIISLDEAEIEEEETK